ncbi:MAG: GNAT family N-acetyltransferase [Candidatus Limnocylindrales bacterium]
MSAEAFAVWRASSIRAYAADKVRVRAWSADEADARAEREFRQLLPDGQATPNHEIRAIVDQAGTQVGVLWFGPTRGGGPGELFIWDIEVDPALRGRGYGRAALAALEAVAGELGFQSIGLHVFGDNDIARNLYRSSGYEETDVNMRKQLG